eukprot:Gb_28132 [translate_table: standard]
MSAFKAFFAMGFASAPKSKENRLMGSEKKMESPRLHHGGLRRPSNLKMGSFSNLHLAHSPRFESNKITSDALGEILREKPWGSMVCAETMPSYNHEPSSACLLDMVHGFMEDEDEQMGIGNRKESFYQDNAEGSEAFHGDQVSDLVKSIASCASPVELILQRAAIKAAKMAQENASGNVCENEESKGSKNCLLQNVMNHLRAAGYNAAICKSLHIHSGSLTAGDYEYIDIIMEGTNGDNTRYLVDMDFRAQFEVARPTNEYSALVQMLPNIFVGKIHRFQKIIKLMCDAMKESVKANGMHLPPWRKYQYMYSKWFGPYKRTTNPFLSGYQSKIKEPLIKKISYTENQNVRSKFREYGMEMCATKAGGHGRSSLASALTKAGLYQGSQTH